MALKELKEQRAELAAKIDGIRSKYDAATASWAAPEDKDNFDQWGKDFDALDAEVKRATAVDAEARKVAERFAAIAALESTPVNTVVAEQVQRRTESAFRMQERAFEGWGRMQYGLEDSVTDEHRNAARALGIRLEQREFNWRLGGAGYMSRGRDLSENQWRSITRELRTAMGVSVDTLGGYTVPEGFVANLEYGLRAYGGVRNVAEIIRTETAQPLPWPTIADTTAGSTDPVYGGALINVGELLGENVGTSLQGTPPQMGAVIFGAQKFSSKLIQISTELLRDSAFNLATYIGKIIGERLGRIMAQRFAWGSGGGIVPRGILTATPAPPANGSLGTGYTTASAAGITFDDLSNFIFSIDPAYRMSPGSKFLVHDKIVGMLRLLKDGQGRYLWTAASVTMGQGPRIWDYEYDVCQEMPYNLSGNYLDSTQSNGVGTGTINKLLLFGDLSKYKIREVATVRMKRLVERFAEYDQDGFIGYMEGDGDLIDAGTHPVGALALHA